MPVCSFKISVRERALARSNCSRLMTVNTLPVSFCFCSYLLAVTITGKRGEDKVSGSREGGKLVSREVGRSGSWEAAVCVWAVMVCKIASAAREKIIFFMLILRFGKCENLVWKNELSNNEGIEMQIIPCRRMIDISGFSPESSAIIHAAGRSSGLLPANRLPITPLA